MPTYEYECRTCGIHFERKQSVHDDPLRTCPDCGGDLRKLFFAAGIIFKGSGFYKTDHASASSIASSKADEKPSPAKTESTKTEPAKGEPAKGEPSKGEPAKVEAAKSEPAKSESKADK